MLTDNFIFPVSFVEFCGPDTLNSVFLAPHIGGNATFNRRQDVIVLTWLGPVTHNVPCSFSGRVLWSDQFAPSLFSSMSRL